MNFLSPAELTAIQAALPLMSPTEKAELLEDLEEKERRFKLNQTQTNLLNFAHNIYPGFKEGSHHRKLAKIFGDVIAGKKKRVIINIAPRMGKSEFSSYLSPRSFWVIFLRRRLSWVPTPHHCLRILVGVYVI